MKVFKKVKFTLFSSKLSIKNGKHKKVCINKKLLKWEKIALDYLKIIHKLFAVNAPYR